MTALERRIDQLEQAQGRAIGQRRCDVCQDWPNLLIRIEGMPDAWPEEPTCPSCGRVPLQVVRIGQRDDGPQ